MSDPTPIGVQLGLKTGREYGEMIVKLRDVIEKAACWFDEYTDLHAAKGTQEGFDKAAVNANRASELRAALGTEPMPKPADWLDPRRPEEWEPAPTDPMRELVERLREYLEGERSGHAYYKNDDDVAEITERLADLDALTAALRERDALLKSCAISSGPSGPGRGLPYATLEFHSDKDREAFVEAYFAAKRTALERTAP